MSLTVLSADGWRERSVDWRVVWRVMEFKVLKGRFVRELGRFQLSLCVAKFLLESVVFFLLLLQFPAVYTHELDTVLKPKRVPTPPTPNVQRFSSKSP